MANITPRTFGILVEALSDPQAANDLATVLASPGGGGGGGGGSTFVWLLGLGMPAATGTSVGAWKVAQAAGTFKRVDLVAKTAPAGADFIVDILKSPDLGVTFTSLWATNPANRPKIVAGSHLGSRTSFDTTAFAIDDIVRLDIIQVGSGTPGQNITVQLFGS